LGGGRPTAGAAQGLERRIAELEAEKERLEREISDCFSRGEGRKGRDLSRRHEKVLALIDRLYQEWTA
jgi:hypothetical protein